MNKPTQQDIDRANEFFKQKAFPSKGINYENWEDFKLNHSGKLWVGFSINVLAEYASEKNAEIDKLIMRPIFC